MPKKKKKEVNYFSPDIILFRKKGKRWKKKINGNISNSMKIRSRKGNVQEQSYTSIDEVIN